MKTVRVAFVAEMKISVNYTDDVKEEVESAVFNIINYDELDRLRLDLRLASRQDLEEMAAEGALLPNPGFIEVKKPKKRKDR